MKYQNWKMNKEYIENYFLQAIDQDEELNIYTTLDHVSKSGMTRYISAYIILDNEPVCITREYKIPGCGMDMGFALAYDLYIESSINLPYQQILKHHWL